MLMTSLDKKQLKAIEHKPGNLLILAGAGSGKTRTLAARSISHLSENKDKLVLIVTFTKKAALEIRERIFSSVEAVEGNDNVWIGTFHSICWKLLRREYGPAGLTNTWSVMDANDTERVFSVAAKAYGIRDGLLVKSLQSLYSYAVNSCEQIEQIILLPRFANLKDIGLLKINNVIDKYVSLCTRSGRVDFDRLQLLTSEILINNIHIRDKYKQSIYSILVDEYQDINNIQNNILKLLSNNNLTVVGDDAQSIYGFRAANVSNILGFEKDQDATKIILDTNYRSSSGIVSLSNYSINHNINQFTKTCKAYDSRPHKPKKFSASTPIEEAVFIAEEVERLLVGGVKASDIAVLCRVTKQTALLQRELDLRSIHFKLVGGTDFFSEGHIKVVLDYLRLIVNPYDSISFTSINNLLEIAPQKYIDDIEIIADSNNRSIWDEVALLNDNISNNINKFRRELDHYRSEFNSSANISQITSLIIRSIKKQIIKYVSISSDELDNDISILLEVASRHHSLIELIDSFANEEVIGNCSDNNNAITISTIHSAKGLEWENVFVVGLVEYWFPLNYAIQASGNDEEERRLFYVAVTRAVTNLTLTTYKTALNQYGNNKKQEQSRFLNEIPDRLLESI